MAQFTVRNVDDDVHRKLRELAYSRGLSLEEFVRELLRKVVLERAAAPKKLGTKISRRYSKIGLRQPIAELRGQLAAPVDFE